MKKILDLFITFFKIGLFTFGGGYAMISVIENECVNKKNWISKEEMQQITILSESTPGPIAINSSTFIGYKVGKTLGSIFATLGVVVPSLIIITIVSIFLEFIQGNIFIEFLFEGIRASVIILMIYAILNLFKHGQKNILFYSLLSLSFILNFFFNVKSLYIIIFVIVFSIILVLLEKKEVKNNV